MDLNLFGTVLPTMVFAEVMVGQGKGSIINISSESSLRPLTRVVGYGCAKAAINNFTQYMAGELAIRRGPASERHGTGILPYRAEPGIDEQSGWIA